MYWERFKNVGYVLMLLFVFFSPNKLNRSKFKLKKLYWKKKF